MELDLTRMTVSQAMAAVREALAQYDSHEAIEIRTDSEVVKLNLYNQLHKMGMRCKLERKGSYFLLKAQPKGKSTERQASRRAARAVERVQRDAQVERSSDFPTSKPKPDYSSKPAVDDAAETNPYAVPRKEGFAFPVSEDRVMSKPAEAKKPTRAAAPVTPSNSSQQPNQEVPLPPSPQQSGNSGNQQPQQQASSYASLVQQQRQAVSNQQGLRAEPPTPPTLFNGEYDERPLEPGQGPWLVLQHDQIGQKDNNLGVELLHQMLESLVPGAYAGVFLVHRGVRLIDPQYQQAKLLRALLRKPIAVFADQTSMEYFKLVGRTSPRVKVVPFAALLELGRTEPVIWF